MINNDEKKGDDVDGEDVEGILAIEDLGVVGKKDMDYALEWESTL